MNGWGFTLTEKAALETLWEIADDRGMTWVRIEEVALRLGFGLEKLLNAVDDLCDRGDVTLWELDGDTYCRLTSESRRPGESDLVTDLQHEVLESIGEITFRPGRAWTSSREVCAESGLQEGQARQAISVLAKEGLIENWRETRNRALWRLTEDGEKVLDAGGGRT
jgi:hypothetical protein